MDRFARRVYAIAGIYGLIVIFPHYFLEGRIERDNPPPITHPEYFYGFIGIVLGALFFLSWRRTAAVSA